MPRKTKKNTEPNPAEPEVATETSQQIANAPLESEAEAQPQIPAAPVAAADAEAEAEAQVADTFDDAFEGEPVETNRTPRAVDDEDQPEIEASEAEEEEEEEDEEEERPPSPPAKLERLQKILAQAGISSRRHAEELITGGRVQVNGQIVTELGSKADPMRDHIRVDGKLLQGAERLRYFMLNKPRGYVTTVSDPEGRPTIMEFFTKMGERVYPVGRLDYLSEGLLLVTNDGELANKLTRAASGVEKAYLVKVSGSPSEEQIDLLREGVSIDRGRPDEGRVRTSPAVIRKVRTGENPWFEVILTEGRNRELRKMFEEIGHHVEKIRRVGYGPLVLDLEPGKVRELDQEEVELLRKVAEGKWKPKRPKASSMLPKEAGRTVDHEAKRGGKPSRFREERGERRGPARGPARGPRRDDVRGADRGAARGGDWPQRRPAERTEGERPRPQGRGFTRPGEDRGPRRDADRGPRRDADRGGERPQRGAANRFEGERPRPQGRGFTRRDDERAPRREGTGGFGRQQSGFGARGNFREEPGERKSFGRRPEEGGERRPYGAKREGGYGERRTGAAPGGRGQGARGERPTGGGQRPAGGQRPYRARPERDQERPRYERPATGNRPPRRPETGEGGFGEQPRRSYRPAGPRPATGRSDERPNRPAGRGFGQGGNQDRKREFPPRQGGSGRPSGPGRGKTFGSSQPREGGERPRRNASERPRREGGAPRGGSKPRFGGRPGGGAGRRPGGGGKRRPE